MNKIIIPALIQKRVLFSIIASASLSFCTFADQLPDLKSYPQLPDSKKSFGHNNIRSAWLANPTSRYSHGVLGDNLEASTLVIEDQRGQLYSHDLPSSRVFEDLNPRLIDINQDQRDEVLLVESDLDLGASLAIYHLHNGQIVKLSSTPFIGLSFRWLNPLGIGDFNGDGKQDIALVSTPHIGGVLRLYQFINGVLSEYGRYSGVSTHIIGHTEMGLGQVIHHHPRDRMLLPTQNRKSLLLIEWGEEKWNVVTRYPLPSPITGSLESLSPGTWSAPLEDGSNFRVQLDDFKV